MSYFDERTDDRLHRYHLHDLRADYINLRRCYDGDKCTRAHYKLAIDTTTAEQETS